MHDAPSIARMIDHTLLAPEATAAEVEALCAEAAELGVLAVCVSPSMLPLAAGSLADGIVLATVVGFPSGAHRAETKRDEAARAVDHGAAEVDMVVDLGRVRSGGFVEVGEEIALVRTVVPGVLKVIVESAVLDDDELVEVCRIAVGAGADFVKTSTGFHARGGATTHAVALMRATVGPDIGVKASGGIRSGEQALAMVAAGATRIGTSSSAKILADLG
jgi:deoxyribose-phosphate aldolase